jgi:hypothetical protein
MIGLSGRLRQALSIMVGLKVGVVSSAIPTGSRVQVHTPSMVKPRYHLAAVL